ncbi:hypothetical protein PILCRDRAFT_292671 [Piloderma croceum F 1598]|uniref:DUF6533 domain-containing protein n=1 Tax=Piloderma croceum (strain F 1598) TaxID=765440 RepID=A0A0C3G527_PILCF|nr:hypothetical protein PILCRDRAFT_292671 [Piloderma croceum F 1598]
MVYNPLVDLILPIIIEIHNARFSTVAASTIIVYDHFVTFDDEIELVKHHGPWEKFCSSSIATIHFVQSYSTNIFFSQVI